MRNLRSNGKKQQYQIVGGANGIYYNNIGEIVGLVVAWLPPL